MKKLYLSPRADQDIDNQYDYFAATDVEVTTKYYHAVFATFNTLCETPFIGVQRPFRNAELIDLRMWFIQSFDHYLLFYRVTDTTIEIVRLLHSSRDIEREMEE